MTTSTTNHIRKAAIDYFGPDDSPLTDEWTDLDVRTWVDLLPADTRAAIMRFADKY